jgi:glycosyltransferase involved in cell wall biosynthesis
LRVAVDGRCIQDRFPGIGRYAFNLVDCLARLREDDFVILQDPGASNTRFDIEPLGRLAHSRVRPIAIPVISWKEQYALRRILIQEGADLYHSPYYVMPYFFLPCRSVVTICDVFPARYPEYLPTPGARMVYQTAIRLALARSHHIIAISQATESDLRRFFGVRPRKITVTHLAASPVFHPRPREALVEVKQRYDLPDRFILQVGAHKPHKNLPRLVEAYARIKNEVGCPLILAGWEDPRWPQTHQAVDRLGLEDSVRFLGDVPEADLSALYNLASLLVMPSLDEGFGLPLLEAMASGTPCASSNAASLVEVAGDAAALFDPRDVPAMAEAIRSVAQDPSLAERLRTDGLARASEFSFPAMARKTVGVYHRCLE